MVDSPASQGRAAKRIKLAGRDSYGKIPKVFSDHDDNIVKMEFDIHDFPNLPQTRGEHLYTGTINAHGHLWKLMVYPRGHSKSKTDVVHVSIYLVYAGKNTETDPVVAKIAFRTKTINYQQKKWEFSKGVKSGYGLADFAKREDIIKKDCNEAGTLTVTVELQVATEKKSIWYPQMTSCDYTRLYKSVETSDVTVMAGTKEFQLHKCVLADRARVLFELVLTEESSSSSSSSGNNNCIVVHIDVSETVFEVLIQFVYSSEEPKLSDLDEETIKSILVAANRFRVTELKLYVESILIEKFLVPSKAAAFLLFADAHLCALLKETSMDAYMTDPPAVIASHSDWTKLQESNKLLTELLLYASAAAGGRKRYSSYVRTVDSNGDHILEDADDLDVTSLRERLQQEAKLDVDGSRSMLVARWKDYLMNA